MYLPALLGLKKAGYGVGSCDASPLEHVLTSSGGKRLCVLIAGVLKDSTVGMLREEQVADRVLSLLRERFDEAGETGNELGADMMLVLTGSVLRKPPLSFALRLSARSLCSVNAFQSVSRRTSSPGD